MEFYDVLRQRRSIRAYQPDPIPQPAMDRVLEAVRIAPSACNLQPWRFLILTSPARKALACGCYARGTWLAAAPVIVVALGNAQAAWKRVNGTSAHVIDVSIAMEHLVLAATAEGLGTCWICAFDQELLRRELGFGAEWEAVAMTPLGYPNAEPRPFERKALCDIVEVQ